MARVPINTLTLEDVLDATDSFETQRGAGRGGQSRRNTRLQMLLAAQKLKGLYDVREAGIVGDGSDETAKFNTAHTEAAADNRFLWIPPKFTIGVSNKVSAKAPMIAGMRAIGMKPAGFASIVNIGINNIYTPMIELDTTANTTLKQFFCMIGVTLDGKNQNSSSLRCTGINVVGGRETPGDFSTIIRCLTYYLLSHSQIANCYGFGARLVGFIGMLEEMFMVNNGINRFILSNSLLMQGGEYVPSEATGTMTGANSWAVQLIASDGKSIPQDEKVHGIRLSSVSIEGIESTRISNGLCVGEGICNLTLDTLYTEGMSGTSSISTYRASFGNHGRSEDPLSATYALVSPTAAQSDAVFGITCINSSFGSGGALEDIGGVAYWNNVNGVEFIGMNHMSNKRTWFTNLAHNIKGLPVGFHTQNDSMYSRDQWITDSSNRLGRRAKNLVLNPNGKGGARGWKNVIDNSSGRITLAQGAATRNGISSLQVLHNGAAVSNYLNEYIRLEPYGNDQRNLAGRFVAGSCWLFVPSGSGSDFASYKLGPAIGFYYEKDTSNGSGTWVAITENRYNMQYSFQDESLAWHDVLFGTRGAWHLVRWWVRLPSLPIRNLAIAVWPIFNENHPANPAYANNISIADLCMCIDPYSVDEMAEGKWVWDENAGLVLPGGAIEVPGTSIPTSTTTAWEIGDRIRRTDVFPGSNEGWVCTVAGVGTAAEWKEFGAIEA